MNKNSTSEKSLRIMTAAFRIMINGLILLFAIFKGASGFSELADAETNHAIKMIIIGSLGADTLLCIGDLYNSYIFRIHYVLNIIVTIMTFLITDAIIGVPSLIVIPLLSFPFVFYTFKNAELYKEAENELREILKNPGNN